MHDIVNGGVKCVSVLLFIATLSVNINFSQQGSLDDDLTITYDQKQKLDEFKENMSPLLPHDYMKKDIYLIRWLRAQDFEIPAAQEMLLKNLEWREQNDMDNIINEDWSEFDREYKINVEGCDREGRPVISVMVGDMDIRRAMISGQGKKMVRYFAKLMEEATTIIRKMQSIGENATQVIFLFDFRNFNMAQQACGQCISVYIYFYPMYEQYYPGTVHKIHSINTPNIAIPIYQMLKPMLSKKVTDIIYIYGRDKRRWQRILAQDIDPSQLSREFGGTRKEALEVDDLRAIMDGYYQCSAN